MKNRQPRTYVGTLHIQFIPINLDLNVKIEAIKCTLLKGLFGRGIVDHQEKILVTFNKI